MRKYLLKLALVLMCSLIAATTIAQTALAAPVTPISYESSTNANANDIFYGPYWRAQTFTPTETHTVTRVEIPLIRSGSAGGDVVVGIKVTGAYGNPTGTDLATGKIAAASVSSSWNPATWYSFDLGSGCRVEAGKTYAIVWRAPNTTASGAMYYWVNLTDSYSGGRVKAGSNSGGSWINLRTWDAAFRESGISGAQSPPEPEPTPQPEPAPQPEPSPGIVEDYESNTNANANDIFYGPYWRAQTFTPAETHTVTRVEIPLIRSGSAGGDVVVGIKVTDAYGNPTGTDLAFGKIAAASVSSSWNPATWYSFDLGSGCRVEAGKTYAIVWRAPNATASGAMYYWVSLTDSYSGGRVKAGSNSGGSWINLRTWDAAFRESGISGAQSDPEPEPTPQPEPDNRAPVLAAIGSKQLTVGQNLNIVLSATDPDGDPLTFTASGLPSGATLTNTTFSWVPAAAGTYSVTFTVSDGSMTDSEAVTITVVQRQTTSGFRNVGYVSIYYLDSVLNKIPWEQFSHIIWQNVWVTSASNPTLRVQDNYPWRQISDLVSVSHANGVKAIVCLFGTYDLVGVTGNPTLRAQLVANLRNLVNTYNLDGINIDWEGGNDPEIYSRFIQELRASLGPDKVISAIGTWLGPPVNISASAAPYLDFVTVMSYDYWHVPSCGTLDVVSNTMNMWANTGFPKDKLVMGIPFFGTTGAGVTGWTPFSTIVSLVNPLPSQNSGGGYYWNGPDLVKQKVKWVKDNGFGGVFNYEIGTDALGHPLSLATAVWEAINSP